MRQQRDSQRLRGLQKRLETLGALLPLLPPLLQNALPTSWKRQRPQWRRPAAARRSCGCTNMVRDVGRRGGWCACALEPRSVCMRMLLWRSKAHGAREVVGGTLGHTRHPHAEPATFSPGIKTCHLHSQTWTLQSHTDPAVLHGPCSLTPKHGPSSLTPKQGPCSLTRTMQSHTDYAVSHPNTDHAVSHL